MGGNTDNVVCFTWSENGEEREFTAPGTSSFRTPDGRSETLPPVGQTMSVWNENVLVVSGTVESVATAYVGAFMLNRWETHVRLKVQE